VPARKEIVGRGAGESSGAGGFLLGGCGGGFVKRLCVRDHGAILKRLFEKFSKVSRMVNNPTSSWPGG
jgi:hypothetical protein